MNNQVLAKRKKTKRWIIAVIVALAIGGGWYLKEGRLWLHGVQAYIYGFPLIVMDVTKDVWTAVPEAGEIMAPINQFAVMTHYPDATFKAIPHTGVDTLFATSWADLDKEPLILSVPDTGERYYVIALFDMWSNVFASIGKRTTGTEAAHFLIAGPKWQGNEPEGITKTFRSPTRFVWVNGQMQADGEKDFAEVNSLQKQYLLTPLSAWGKPYRPPASVPINKDIDTKTPTLEQVQKMDGVAFFSRLAKLMAENPPATADGPMVAKLKTLGIEPGKTFDITGVDSSTVKALNRSTIAYKLLQKGVQKLKTHDGWIVIPADFADYGTDYMTRAGIALIGLGGIWPKDILYPTAFLDLDDKPLDSANQYVLHFDKDQFPPVKALWSISMYTPPGFYVPNTLNRYHLAGWMDMTHNSDGSLDIYIQAESPGPDKEANWLPAPAKGRFNLVTRLFWPDKAALDGTWKMPGVRKL